MTIEKDCPPKKFQVLGGKLYRFRPRSRYAKVINDCTHCVLGNGNCNPQADCRGGYMVNANKDSDEYLTARLRGEV